MDPEIFAAVRDEFPDQIEEILIRDVRGDAQVPGSSRLHNMTIIPP
jgi:phosphatidate phosphatase APP1